MKVTLKGVRGSIPTTQPEMAVYGGNTSCVLIEEDHHLLILDAGSGLQHVMVDDYLKHDRIDILLTHLHIDHIQGLAFFKPLFNPNAEVHIWGPASQTQKLRARLGRYFSPPLFPVYFRNLSCQLAVNEIGNDEFTIGPFTITSQYVIHPGPTVGFRVTGKQGVFCYLPDHEPALGPNGIQRDLTWLSGADLAIGADLLFHDAQYTELEYRDKKGWGHSSMEDAIAYASMTRVGHLLLAHHDPGRTDVELDRLQQTLQLKTPPSLKVEMAKEKSLFEL